MLVREWFVLFMSLAERDVAVSKLDNVYRSATAMKLCIVALRLPEAFLAIHACLTGFWKSSLEASYMFMLQMLSGQGCVHSAAVAVAGSALLCRSVWLLQLPALALPSHLHLRTWVLTPQTWSICREGLRMTWVKVGLCKSRDSWTLWPADLADW